MRITIPDALADQYDAMATTQGRTLDQVITAQLERFAAYAPGTRVILVDDATCRVLEQRLGGGSISTTQDLTHKLQQLAGVKFRNQQFDFNPAQLAELEHRATRQGRPVGEI